MLNVLGTAPCVHALHMLKQLVHPAMVCVHDGTPEPRSAPSGAWSERTVIAKDLSMAEHLSKAICLDPIAIGSKSIGLVLQAVVRVVSGMRDRVAGYREEQRAAIERIVLELKEADAAIHAFVPSHGSELCRHVNFAFCYLACEAIGYVDNLVVDGMLA